MHHARQPHAAGVDEGLAFFGVWGRRQERSHHVSSLYTTVS
jgi:hypothetical protein